jgi:hypothetical protein
VLKISSPLLPLKYFPLCKVLKSTHIRTLIDYELKTLISPPDPDSDSRPDFSLILSTVFFSLKKDCGDAFRWNCCM